jgi:hypothetical protein
MRFGQPGIPEGEGKIMEGAQYFGILKTTAAHLGSLEVLAAT